MKYAITFERVVTQTDRFTRIIEADSLEEACARAEAAAGAYDENCPDDAAPFGGDECGSWEVHDVTFAAADANVDELLAPSDDY